MYKEKHWTIKLITLAICLFIAFFLYMLISNVITGLRYPKELYELVNVNYTYEFLAGKNPFSRSSMVQPGELPPVAYSYPFFNSVIAIVISVFTGGDLFVAHYIVSILCIIGTGLMGALMVRRYARTTIGPSFAFLMLMICHWRYGYGTTGPDSLALFLTMVVIYIATNPKIKHKEIWCTIGFILIFYTKWYLVTICVSIFFYFFICSRKSAFKLLGLCVVLTGMSIILVTLSMPLLWDYSVFFLMASTLNTTGESRIGYVLEQVKYLSFILAGLYGAILTAIFKHIISKEKTKKIFVENEPFALLIINCIVQIPAIMYFARNDGAYLTYLLQLICPSIILTAIIAIERMEYKKAWLYRIGYGAVVLFTVYFGWFKLPMHMLTETEKSTWETAYSLMDEKRQEGEIFHYTTTAYEGYKKGDITFQTGHDSVGSNKIKIWNDSELYRTLFPDAGKIHEEMEGYRKVSRDKISNQEASLVTIPGGGDAREYWYIQEDLLKEAGYEKYCTLDLAVGNMTYPTEFWIKQDSQK